MELTPQVALQLIRDAPVGFAITGLEETPDGIELETSDPDLKGRKFAGPFYWVNAAYCRILERTEGQLLAGDWIALTPEPDRTEDVKLALRSLSGEIGFVEFHKCYKLRGAKGQERNRFALIRYDVVKDEHGKQYFAVACQPVNGFYDPAKREAVKWLPYLEWAGKNWDKIAWVITVLVALIFGRSVALPKLSEPLPVNGPNDESSSGSSSSALRSSDG